MFTSMRSNKRYEEEGESGENSEEETYRKPVSDQKIQNRRGFLKSVKKVFMVLFVSEVSLVDPLFFYIPVINDWQKCVYLDKKLGIAVMVFRSLIDFFYVIYIIAQLQKHFSLARSRKYQYIRLEKYSFLNDFLAVLPLPQVVILIIPAMRGSRFLNAMYLLRSVVLCQFVPRSFRAYLFIASGTFGERAKARVKFSPFIYMLGIDVMGALWYYLSIERLVQCWNKACESHVGCVNSFYCKDNIGDRSFLKEFCPTDTRKTDFFDFGIFSYALQSGVVEMTYFPKKVVYCFQWSLQNLSGFGQNLQTSTYIFENLFAISMSILGMLLFLLLIGNLQTSMASLSKERAKKEKLKAMKSMENWPPLKKFSVDLKKEIKDYFEYRWDKNPTDASIILHELPSELKRRIRCEAGLESLKKVKAFKGIGQNLLDDLSRSIELTLFEEGDYIMQMGDTVVNMIFIMRGKLEVKYDIDSNIVLKDGDIFGEEVTWDVFNDRCSSSLWGLTMTTKALTKVDALVLPAYEVRDFLYRLPGHLKRSVRHELCFDLLMKVKAFKPIGQNELQNLTDSIKLVSFEGGEDIVREGDTTNNIVFIVEGILEAYSSTSISERNSTNILSVGDLWGEEVTWDAFNDWSSELPRSTMTIKARTRIHALVLRTYDVREILDRLPGHLKRSIRRELCFDLLTKVKVLQSPGQYELEDLSEFIRLQLYKESECIVQEGDTMDKMVFIVQGKVEVYSSSHNERNPIKVLFVLKEGDFFGEEVTWDASEDWSSELPKSTETFKAFTRVQALVLRADTLRNFLRLLPESRKTSIRRICDVFKKFSPSSKLTL